MAGSEREERAAAPHDSGAEPSFRRRLLRGEVMYGLMVYEFFTQGLPRLLRQAGLDFAIFDMEATPLSLERLAILARASHAAGLTALARVPSYDSDAIGRCLNLGITGIMAPHVEDAEQAAAFVSAAKFPPLGGRGAGYRGFPDTYLDPPSARTLAEANDEVLTICQLESAAAIGHADEIAALPGVDVLIVGANDLTAEFGFDGAAAGPAVRDATARARAACARHGKVLAGRAERSGPGNAAGPGLVLIEHDTAALARRLRDSLLAARGQSR